MTVTKILLSRAQSLHAGEGYIFKNLEKDGDTFHQSFSISFYYFQYYGLNLPFRCSD